MEETETTELNEAEKIGEFLSLCSKVQSWGFDAGVLPKITGSPERVFYVQKCSVRMFEANSFSEFKKYCEALCSAMTLLRDKFMVYGQEVNQNKEP